jgi:hypothetical protein
MPVPPRELTPRKAVCQQRVLGARWFRYPATSPRDLAVVLRRRPMTRWTRRPVRPVIRQVRMMPLLTAAKEHPLQRLMRPGWTQWVCRCSAGPTVPVAIGPTRAAVRMVRRRGHRARSVRTPSVTRTSCRSQPHPRLAILLGRGRPRENRNPGQRNRCRLRLHHRRELHRWLFRPQERCPPRR